MNITVFTDVTFRVGFESTEYRVNEQEGSVMVCVSLLSPTGDIGDVELFLEVNEGIMTGSTIPGASKFLFHRPLVV